MTHRLLSIFLLSVLPLCVQAQQGFPVVEKAAQKARDEDRKFILETELSSERAVLVKVQAEFDSKPTAEHEADVHRHSENVKALERELNGTAGKRLSKEAHETTRPVARAVVRAVQPVVSAAREESQPQYWDPYNRAPKPTDFSTTPKEGKP